MIAREHIDNAYLRLQELDALTDYPVGSDEWWGVIAAEVGFDPDGLAAVCHEIAPKELDLWPATRGLLVGLLAHRYAMAREPGEVL